MLFAGGFVLGEWMSLQGKGGVLRVCVLLGAILLCAYGRRKQGRRIVLGLLPCCILLGLLRGGWERDAYEREWSYALDGALVQASGSVCEITEKETGTTLVLDQVQLLSAEVIWKQEGTMMAQGAKTIREQERAKTQGAETLCEQTGTESQGEETGYVRKLMVSVDAEMKEGFRVRIGDQVSVSGTLHTFSPARNLGEFDAQKYYRGFQLTYRMYADTCEVICHAPHSYRAYLHQFRVWAKAQWAFLTDAERAGVFQAMLLGDKSGLSKELQELYQRNGISHMLAVSGTHLSLVSFAVYGILRKLGVGFGAAGVAGAVGLWLYACLTGASPSVLRAFVMAVSGFLAAYLGRTYDLLSAMSLSAIFLFWDRPYLLEQVGVQLSYGAILGIGSVAPLVIRYALGEEAPSLKKRVKEAVLFGISMQLVTMPIQLYHFFAYPMYSVCLNLIVVPLMGIVVGSGAAGLLLRVYRIAWGRFAIAGGCVVLGWYRLCAGWFSKLPWSYQILGRPNREQILFYYGCLGMILFLMAQSVEKRKQKAEKKMGKESEERLEGKSEGKSRKESEFSDDKWEVWKRRGRMMLLLGIVLVLFPIPTQGLTVTFLDVGQGDGICLRVPEGVVLVDGGSSDQKYLAENRLEPYLSSQAITRIDYAVVTHGDTDHISGLQDLLENAQDVEIGMLLMPKAGRGDDVYAKLAELAKKRDCKVHWMKEGDALHLGKLSLECLYPFEKEVQGMEVQDRNAHSLVLLAEYGECSLLLTGDMEAEGERLLLERMQKTGERDRLREITVLKAAHHGSQSSNIEAWLETIAPRWAVVSYGEGNRYGHPHEEVLARFERCGIKVWKTGESGAITFWTNGKEIKWKTQLK